MGTQYYAVNTLNKTFYGLGKGGWYALDKEYFQNEELLILEISQQCFHMDQRELQEREELKLYIKERIVPDLLNFIQDTPLKNFYIINDCTDDLWILKCKKYKCVGSRFYQKNSNDYVENLLFSNRHLENSDLNKKWYNINDCQNYPNFDIF